MLYSLQRGEELLDKGQIIASSETVETEEAYIVFYNYLLLFFMLAVFIRYNNKNDEQKNINNKNQC